MKAYWDILIGNWFLNGYTVLMLMVPMINIVLERAFTSSDDNERRGARFAIGCLLLLTLGWGWLTTVPHFNKFVPMSSGVKDYSGLALVGIYVFARVCRFTDFFNISNLKCELVAAIICGIGILLHCGSYSSPFSAVLIAIIFKHIVNLKAPAIFCALAPSMFTVFFFHANPIGFRVMGAMQDWLTGRGFSIDFAMLLTAMIAFVFGIAADIPRRIIVKGFVKR